MKRVGKNIRAFNIRRAVYNDALGIAKVQVESWRTTYKNIIPDAYLQQMTIESREKKWKQIIVEQLVYVAETEEGEIIGFANGGREKSGKYPDYQSELYAIYILEQHQRKGIGKRLIEEIVQEFIADDIFTMTVQVLEQNRFRLFYESLGAEKIDEKELEIAGKTLIEFVYAWEDIRVLL